MITVGVRELKQQASELIRLAREEGRRIQITYRGEVVALLVPVSHPVRSEEEAAWANLEVLAAEIEAVRLFGGVSSVEVVAEDQK